jgi:hypothetical protein
VQQQPQADWPGLQGITRRTARPAWANGKPRGYRIPVDVFFMVLPDLGRQSTTVNWGTRPPICDHPPTWWNDPNDRLSVRPHAGLSKRSGPPMEDRSYRSQLYLKAYRP